MVSVVTNLDTVVQDYPNDSTARAAYESIVKQRRTSVPHYKYQAIALLSHLNDSMYALYIYYPSVRLGLAALIAHRGKGARKQTWICQNSMKPSSRRLTQCYA